MTSKNTKSKSIAARLLLYLLGCTAVALCARYLMADVGPFGFIDLLPTDDGSPDDGLPDILLGLRGSASTFSDNAISIYHAIAIVSTDEEIRPTDVSIICCL